MHALVHVTSLGPAALHLLSLMDSSCGTLVAGSGGLERATRRRVVADTAAFEVQG